MQKARNHWVWGMLLITLIACTWLEFNESGAPDDDLLPAKNSAKRLFTPELVTSSNFLISQHDDEPKSLKAHIFRVQIIDDPQSLFQSAYLSPSVDMPTTDVAVEQPLTLPFVYVGKLSVAGETTVFISDGSRHFSVQINDIIDGVWQVTAIKPPMMTFRNIPQKIDSQLTIGAIS